MNVMDIDELIEALQDRKLSLVAEATGIHPNTLSDIKNGRSDNPTLKTLKALSDYFNVSRVSALLSGPEYELKDQVDEAAYKALTEAFIPMLGLTKWINGRRSAYGLKHIAEDYFRRRNEEMGIDEYIYIREEIFDRCMVEAGFARKQLRGETGSPSYSVLEGSVSAIEAYIETGKFDYSGCKDGEA